MSFRQVAAYPTHNIFNYAYEPITDASNKTGNRLLVLGDVVRYVDTFRMLKLLYGDNSLRHKLEDNFGKKYPNVVSKYFSDTSDLPDYIKNELGI